MIWSIPQEAFQPMSRDILIGPHQLWLRSVQDTLVFESVKSLVDIHNQEDPEGVQWEKSSMTLPKGVSPARMDVYSLFGRAPFHVQDVDAGWLLEYSNGVPLGYIHASWSVHTPDQPELDPVIGLQVHLEEIMLRPALRQRGIGQKMVQHVAEHINRHVAHVYNAHPRLLGLSCNTHVSVQALSPSGKRMLDHLMQKLKEPQDILVACGPTKIS